MILTKKECLPYTKKASGWLTCRLRNVECSFWYLGHCHAPKKIYFSCGILHWREWLKAMPPSPDLSTHHIYNYCGFPVCLRESEAIELGAALIE